jgi:hypothetical protein
MGPGAAGPSPKIAAVNRWGPGFTILQPERNSSSLARVRVRNSGCVRLFGPTSSPGKYPRLMYAPGSETGPGPQLVTWGRSTILSVDAYGFKFEYTSNSAKHIPFDWTGPAPYRPPL